MPKNVKKSTKKTKAKKVVKAPVKKKVPAKNVWPPKGYLVTDFAKDFERLISDRANKWPLEPRNYSRRVLLKEHLAAVALVMERMLAKVKDGQPEPAVVSGPFFEQVDQLLKSWPPVQKPNVTLWDLERALDLMLQAVNKALGGGGGNQQLPPE